MTISCVLQREIKGRDQGQRRQEREKRRRIEKKKKKTRIRYGQREVKRLLRKVVNEIRYSLEMFLFRPII